MQTTVQHIAILSVHTCPLAMLGGKKTGGMNVYVRDFARELGKRGVKVDVFTRSQDDCIPQVMHDLGPNARVIHIPAGPERPIPVVQVAEYLEEFASGVARFARVQQIEYDVIHSHYWLSGLVAEALRKRWQRHIPIVQMFHTLGHMKNKIATDDITRAPQNRIDGETHVIASVADTLIAATPAEESQLIEFYGADADKITVIPPGVDLGRFQPIPKVNAKQTAKLDQCKKVILLAARIEPLKGIDTLLKAVALVDQKCANLADEVCVIIVGGDPWAENLEGEMARLQTLRAELDITKLVTFVGSKDQLVLPNYYASAEMVVMPSHYESFGLVALEAMAMGIPVIASEVGGLAYLVRDGVTGYHVPSRDPEALAERIFELLTDEPQREKMGDCAHVYAETYAWKHIVDQMLRVYETNLEATPRPIDSFNFETPNTLPCASGSAD